MSKGKRGKVRRERQRQIGESMREMLDSSTEAWRAATRAEQITEPEAIITRRHLRLVVSR